MIFLLRFWQSRFRKMPRWFASTEYCPLLAMGSTIRERYGQNFQKLGKDLASVDELAVLDGSKCILQLRGVRPFLSDKYDLTQHPNYKYTSDFDKRNEFNIEQFLSRRLKLKAGDEFVVVDAD